MRKFLVGVSVGIFMGLLAVAMIFGAKSARSGAREKDNFSFAKPLKILDLRIEGHFPPSAASDGKVAFSPTDKVIISYDVAELFALRPKSERTTESAPLIHIRQDLIVRDSKGDVLIVKPSIIDLKKPLPEKPARFMNEIYLGAVKNLSAGDYEITVILTDLVGFQTAKGVLKFSVLPPRG